MEARQGRNPDSRGSVHDSRPSQGGQAQTPTMKGLLEATRRWDIPVAGYSHEVSQATASGITPERRDHILGVDRVDHPKPTYLRYGLDVRRPN